MAVCWLSARTCRGRASARLFVLARHCFSFSRHSFTPSFEGPLVCPESRRELRGERSRRGLATSSKPQENVPSMRSTRKTPRRSGRKAKKWSENRSNSLDRTGERPSLRRWIGSGRPNHFSFSVFSKMMSCACWKFDETHMDDHWRRRRPGQLQMVPVAIWPARDASSP
jgi:hypothetical protein